MDGSHHIPENTRGECFTIPGRKAYLVSLWTFVSAIGVAVLTVILAVNACRGLSGWKALGILVVTLFGGGIVVTVLSLTSLICGYFGLRYRKRAWVWMAVDAAWSVFALWVCLEIRK